MNKMKTTTREKNMTILLQFEITIWIAVAVSGWFLRQHRKWKHNSGVWSWGLLWWWWHCSPRPNDPALLTLNQLHRRPATISNPTQSLVLQSLITQWDEEKRPCLLFWVCQSLLPTLRDQEPCFPLAIGRKKLVHCTCWRVFISYRISAASAHCFAF